MFTDSFDQNPCEDYVSEGNNGDEQWEKFVKNHENILGVLSGHVVTGDGIGYLASIGDNGNEVHQLLANYQSYENGGNGWLRLMIFDLEKNEVCVETYSPWLDQMDTASDQEFCFDYDFNSEESLNVKSVDNKEDSDSGSSSSRKKRSSSSSDSSSNFDQYLEENVYYDEENDVIVLGNYGTIYLDTEDQTLIARMINFFRGVFG
jgi:hypothetical protein